MDRNRKTENIEVEKAKEKEKLQEFGMAAMTVQPGVQVSALSSHTENLAANRKRDGRRLPDFPGQHP